ncbi:AfsR/SARP family transcriptional regulator [Isoptericola croceus]|uniref:AfsR/SARP family transcriptional regulator n=1 Tax=Isoptericola croceus TaxID=3031406 RepID=UPI0023F99185|nr:BTAD domain-containing putative transcriptional regulator [Isoptericola croceus]
MIFGTLGSLRVVTDDGRDVAPAGRVQRTLLALLLVHANRPVPVDTLVEAIWPDDRSGRAQAKLQLAVHRLRTALGEPHRIAYDAGGYRIRVAEAEYDVARFDALVSRMQVRGVVAGEAWTLGQEALALWRGGAFEDFFTPEITPEIARCEARRRWVQEVCFEAAIARGRQSAVLGDLEGLANDEPMHERLQALLMRALHADGRTAEALEVYSRARSALVEELGLEPGRDLQDEHARVLAGEHSNSAARAVPTVPAQLPRPTPDLIGREDHLAAIDRAMTGGSRACVVTGTAGVGKTAVALAWAHAHRTDFEDGQLFVDLRGFSGSDPVDPAETLSGWLRTLGIEASAVPTGLADRSALFRSLLAERRVLVVLDNARSSDQVRPLVPGTTSCAVLVTSRETLPGIAAREGVDLVELKPLAPSAADRLLQRLVGDRAARQPGAVRDLGRACGRLPLALRVVAQQARARPEQPLEDMVAELGDIRRRLDVLDPADGAATDLRAVLSWSYTALAPSAAHLFRLLGLLPGVDADEAALVAMSGADRRDLRRRLDALTQAHLVERDRAGRYRQHDLLRAYAHERAWQDDPPEVNERARTRLLEHYARAAAGAAGLAQSDRSGADGLPAGVHDAATGDRWLAKERDNVLDAVAVARVEDATTVFELVEAYGHHLRVTGRHEEALRLHAQQLALAESVGDLGAARAARMGVGNVRMRAGDRAGAEADYRAAAAVSERADDPLGRAAAVMNLGGLAFDRGRLLLADARLQESVHVFREHREPVGLTIGLCRLGDSALAAGRPEEAEQHFAEALRWSDEHDVAIARGEALVGLAESALACGDSSRAEEHAREAMAMSEDHPGSEDEPVALSALAAVRITQGRTAEADELFSTVMRLAHRLGAVDVTMSVIRRYVVAAPHHVADPLFREAIAYAVEHGFAGVEAELRSHRADVLRSRGEPDAARAELHRARALFAALDDPRAAQLAE